MGYGIRFTLIDNEDQVYRVSYKKYDELFQGKAALPQFAGQRLRVVEAAVELKDRKFVRCVRVLFHYLSFDAKGFVDRERKREESRMRMEVGMPALNIGGETDEYPSEAELIGKDAEDWLRQEVIRQEFEWSADDRLLGKIAASWQAGAEWLK